MLVLALIAYAVAAVVIACVLMASDLTSNEGPALVGLALLAVFWPVFVVAGLFIIRVARRPAARPE